MARFSTTPVLFCNRCGKPLVLTMGYTVNDPSGENLHLVAKAASENALCRACNAKRNWYAASGRIREWELGLP